MEEADSPGMKEQEYVEHSDEMSPTDIRQGNSPESANEKPFKTADGDDEEEEDDGLGLDDFL